MADNLFTPYERIETCRRTKITAENIAKLAERLCWSVNYSGEEPTLQPTREGTAPFFIGEWIDDRGSRWNPDPISQGWSPAGSFVAAASETREAGGQE